MVAKINTSKNLLRTLNYNEQKVRQGKACLLEAVNFLKDTAQLSFNDKLRHLQQFTSLNDRVQTHTLHISLNFAPGEKLSPEKLRQISHSYMEQIGFDHQPYLVYQHNDAGHPHLHLLTLTIQSDGTHISVHNIGRNQSQTARRNIEKAFGLIPAEGRKKSLAFQPTPVVAEKIIYGKSETKQAIARVLAYVLPTYKFASLPELNAVLQLYHVRADRGLEQSRTFRHHGLVYRVLDAGGKDIGIPIKASSLPSQPTLKNLEHSFAINELSKAPQKEKLKTTLDWHLKTRYPTLTHFINELEQENISTVLRKNKDNRIYGITYIDNRTHCVFNGSNLGKSYSAQGILQAFPQQTIASSNKEIKLTREYKILPMPQVTAGYEAPRKAELTSEWTAAIKPLQTQEPPPYQLTPHKKNKMKKSRTQRF